MLKYGRAVISSLLICGVFWRGEACNTTAWRICTALARGHATQQVAMVPVFPYFDDADLIDLCRTYKSLTKCSAFLKESCDVSGRRLHDGIDAALNYLCGSGYRKYQENRECYVKPAVVSLGRLCNSSYHASLNQLLHDDRPLHEKQEALCMHIDSFIFCLDEGIGRECGSRAADWITGLKTILLQPSRTELGCLNARQKPVVTFGIIIGVILFLCIVTVACLMFHHRRQQPRMNYNSTPTE